jgi:hypothetical protein
MEERTYMDPFHDKSSFERLKDEIVSNGFLGIRIISDSMYPLIKVGEKVTVCHYINEKQLTRFIPVLYWDGSKLICHYFWNKSRMTNADGKQTILTRSLKENKINDIPVPTEHILGIVVGKKVSFTTQVLILINNFFSSNG